MSQPIVPIARKSRARVRTIMTDTNRPTRQLNDGVLIATMDSTTWYEMYRELQQIKLLLGISSLDLRCQGDELVFLIDLLMTNMIKQLDLTQLCSLLAGTSRVDFTILQRYWGMPHQPHQVAAKLFNLLTQGPNQMIDKFATLAIVNLRSMDSRVPLQVPISR